MTYRIFTNDRESVGGVPMYSAFKEVEAVSSKEALKYCPPQFDAPFYAPAVAIPYPENFQSDYQKSWLSTHVYATFTPD